MGPLRPVHRYVLIGVLWELWHFTNRVHTGTPGQIALRLAISYPAVILLAWLIGEAVERTRSLLAAHTLHLWVNLLVENAGTPTFVVFAGALVFWGVLLRTWTAPPPDHAPVPG